MAAAPFDGLGCVDHHAFNDTRSRDALDSRDGNENAARHLVDLLCRESWRLDQVHSGSSVDEASQPDQSVRQRGEQSSLIYESAAGLQRQTRP